MSSFDQTTRSFYRERGIGVRTGFGDRPAVMIVDMQVGLDDPAYKVGADQTPAVEAIASLLPHARERRVPLLYIRTGYRPDGSDGGMFVKKIPGLLELQVDSPAFEIDPRIPPGPEDYVVHKRFTSAFFQTNVPALLMELKIDTIILTGCSTSGCIRAAAMDGISYGYRIIVPEECVSDRAEGPHRANLLDIDSKYGDVLPLSEVIEYLDALTLERDVPQPVAPAGR